MIVLDTNVCIEVMRDPNQSEKLVELLARNSVAFAVLSSVSLYELEMGILGRVGEKQARMSLNALLNGPLQVEPLANLAARNAAKLNAAARNRGQQLSALDSLIAGHASALGAMLVTSNARFAAAIMGEVEVVLWR